MELLVATTNPNKIEEITGLLSGLPITLRTLRDFQPIEIPEETEATFQANARKKALHYAQATRCLTVAEDSGFEVKALNGEPGIYSARYLREDAAYAERFAEIHRRVRETGSRDRRARFVCALAVAECTEVVFETTAAVDGTLADTPAGSNGFGYDPIFFYPPYGKTFGEATDAEKNAVSHRGQAIRNLGLWLASSFRYGRNEFLLD